MIDVRDKLTSRFGKICSYYSLPRLADIGFPGINRLPVSIRVLLESVLRNLDGKRVRETDVEAIARWKPNGERVAEVPFVVGRVLLQDFTGVPLIVDLAAMRSAVARKGKDPGVVQPLVPVDLVIDHSIQVDYFGRPESLQLNLEMEFARNSERYRFLKWGAQAFNGLRIVPPGFGICHQVNLEFLAQGVLERDGVAFPDTLVGTDSHTTMINGSGVVGWGVGGIEAEAAMLGQPVYFLTPDVVGVHLHGRLRNGVTATDLVLFITELLRKTRVVDKFVEFHGEGAANLSVPDRATIGNMAPEYGATIGYFPIDEQTCRYLKATGRSREQVELVRSYYQAQEMFGIPLHGQCDYTTLLEVDLGMIEPSVAGPKRPQDRLPLNRVKQQFRSLLTSPSGYAKSEHDIRRDVIIRETGTDKPLPGGGEQSVESTPAPSLKQNTSVLTETEMMNNRPTPDRGLEPVVSDGSGAYLLRHGSVVIAAITSCTNTSNPTVMLAAGLLAKKANERGLHVPPWVKTSLAPGSRVVSDYLTKTGLQTHLDRLGFNVVGYGCTTCIGNSGPLDRDLEEGVINHDLIVASVLSGNRNFEARVHQSVKANFLMSPPLVVAYALAGRVDIDFDTEPLGGDNGDKVFLRDLWPSTEEINAIIESAFDPEQYRKVYEGFAEQNQMWNVIPIGSGHIYQWEPQSSYIREPPYFHNTTGDARSISFQKARALAIFGDSITTDHISPAGAIKPSSAAGRYLIEQGVPAADFNSYGARRGNHEVMMRGTFANIRIRNLMAAGAEGGVTRYQPGGEPIEIYNAAQRYRAAGVPLIVFAGQDYGTGSSRDWAAKGTALLGVRAVIAQSFERIHRANLVGMGVLPCQFGEGVNTQSLGIDGSELFHLELPGPLRPRQQATLHIERAGAARSTIPLLVRVDTPIEVSYYSAGGILPYMLTQFTS